MGFWNWSWLNPSAVVRLNTRQTQETAALPSFRPSRAPNPMLPSSSPPHEQHSKIFARRSKRPLPTDGRSGIKARLSRYRRSLLPVNTSLLLLARAMESHLKRTTKTRPVVARPDFARAILQRLAALPLDVSGTAPQFARVERIVYGDHPILSEVGVRFCLVDHPSEVNEALISGEISSVPRQPRPILGPNSSYRGERTYDFTFFDPDRLDEEFVFFNEFVKNRAVAPSLI